MPATQAHVIEMYGSPLPVTIRGLAAVDGDKVQMLACIYPEDGRMILAFKATPEARANMRAHTRTILKGARRLIGIACSSKLPLQAMVDTRYPRAAELAEHLGFRKIEKDIYQWQT